MITNYWFICGLLAIVIVAAGAFFIQSDSERNRLAERTGEMNGVLAKLTEDQARTIKELTQHSETTLHEKDAEIAEIRKKLENCQRTLSEHDKNPLSQQVEDLSRKLAELTLEHGQAIREITKNQEVILEQKDAEIANFRRKMDAYVQTLAEHETNPHSQQSGDLARKLGELIKIHAQGIKEITKSHETALRHKEEEVAGYRDKLAGYTEQLSSMQSELQASHDTVKQLQAELARLKA